MYPTDPNERAAHAIRRVLGGDAPNGIAPETCGAWQDTVRGLYDGYAAGGSTKARQVYDTLAKAHPPLARLVSEEAKPSDGWGGILPFHAAELPAFPLDIFPPWLRDFCEAVTEAMQTPPDLAGMLALSILSTACARRVGVRAWDGWDEPVNVYTVTSLMPGSRKSPVFRAMMAPLIKFEQEQAAKLETEIAQGEARRDILKNQIESAKRKAGQVQGENAIKQAFAEVDGMLGELKEMDIPARPKLIVDDVTPETVASILADQGGRLSILSPEGDIFGIMAGRYSAGPPNIGVYLKGHAGDAIRVDRKTRSEYIKQPALTMGITTQPDVMRSFGSNSAFRGQGLLARFFYALPTSTVGNRAVRATPIPEDTKREYFRTMMFLLEYMETFNSENSGNSGNDVAHSGNSVTDLDHYDSTIIYYIEISDIGRNTLVSFAEWLEPQLGPYGALNHMADWAAKLVGAVLRVAGLLHMAEYAYHNSHNSQNAISNENITRAIRLAHYLIAHAQAAYAEIGADPAVDAAKTVLRWIEKTGARTFTKRDCYQGVKGTLKRADDLDPVLSLLADHGYIKEQDAAERTGPGRKASPPYEVNPLFFDGSHNSHNSQNIPPAASYEPPPAPEYRERGYTPLEGY